ncbi:MAG TPA: MFS transporter [Thermomicrobiales bacterium]|nr:MFS transporter [Thermomicrobiales bacterium]
MSRSRTPLYALLAANTLSFIAEAISIVAIPWFVLGLTGSASQVGLIGFFTVLPRVIATFLGGQVVDRIGFQTSSILSDLLSGLSVCGIPILYALGHLTFSWLVMLVIFGAVFDGPGATAREAMVPELASGGEMDLDRVNAFFQGSRRLSIFIGPAIAGFLIVWVGAANVLWVNAAVFALSALITVTLIPAVAVPKEIGEAGSFRNNMMFGFRFLKQHRLLAWLAGILCLMNFLDGPIATVMLPVLVQEHYGSAEQLGLLLSSFGFGSVAGTILFSAMSTRFPRRMTFIGGLAVLAVLNLLVELPLRCR